MEKADILKMKKFRLSVLRNNGKNNGGTSGVCKRLEREIRALESGKTS